ncbi:Activin receptor type-1C [Cichlidogyrus casuarinus]|uniref:receptor protein serine/threonine kinase n=1 Tax=Cichlidogyrus casuarinus TaxID=1844966 RepID=A0ABD2PVW6_9PLAT
MGFAMAYDSTSHQVDPNTADDRVGTRRYMAPEVLTGTLKSSSFEAYLQADIYSLSLVLWEITRAGYHPQVEGFIPYQYQMPYEVCTP